MNQKAREEALTAIAQALIAAEAGDERAWTTLDDVAIRALAIEAGTLVRSVPHALGCLVTQLTAHPRAAFRIECCRMLTLLAGKNAERLAALRQLTSDQAKTVRNAANRALASLGAPEAMDEGPTRIETAPPTVITTRPEHAEVTDEGWDWDEVTTTAMPAPRGLFG